MKLFFKIKYNIAVLLLSLLLLGLIVLALFKYSRYTKEGFNEYVRNNDDENNQSVVNARRSADVIGEKIDSVMNTVDDSIGTKMDAISSFIDTTTKVKLPQWRHVYDNGVSVPDTITTGLKPDTSLILADGCSKKSILKSDYEEDFCLVYKGDYETIDAKCKALSNDNCSIPSCCILLNGTKCVSGNVNGPTYLTDQGNQIDFYYYLYRNTCYGKGCTDSSNNYQRKCGKYANNSTNISKDCMVSIFNNAGCTNPNPVFVINDDYVYNNSKSSKKYIQNDLTAIAKQQLSDIARGDDDSRIKCLGDPNNPCDQFLSMDKRISKACMVKMYNNAGCPNKVAPMITNDMVDNYRNTNKSDIKQIITNATTLLKYEADSGINPRSIPLCYGNDVTVSPNASSTNASSR